MDIQVQMCERAIELLLLPEDEPCFLLDIGCGSGLSGSVLEEQNHVWIGVDISSAMLSKYVNKRILILKVLDYLINFLQFLEVAIEREVEGDLILGDMGQGMPFRAGSFDGAVSISALQWLCNADKSSHNPIKRLYKFFSTLFECLSRTARAVFQFYPENSDQIELVTTQATKAGFYGGIVVDYPNSTKAKKFFLVLMTGGSMPLPKALGEESDNSMISYTSKREQMKKARGKSLKKSRDWIIEKKERRRRQNKETRPDSKYTGRKRSGRF